MEWWSDGVMEWWSGGVVEWWSGGASQARATRDAPAQAGRSSA